MLVFSQRSAEQLLRCHVVSDSVGVEGINIVNLVNEQTAISDSNGDFSILVKLDDMLILTSINFEYKRRIIEQQDLTNPVLTIEITPKVTQLNEVIVNPYPNITAEKLGIVPKGQKRYSPAERKLETAGDFKPIQLLSILGGSMPLDPVLNAINGRTSRLKDQLAIERKELLLEKIKARYSDEFLIGEMGIANENIGGFQYYIVDDSNFVEMFTQRKNELAALRLATLAVQYNEIISCENQ